MKKMSKSGRYTTVDIPTDIFRDIWLSLPVKSLLRFKSVSKRWCSIITSPNFVARRFRYASSRDDHLVMIKHCLQTSYRVHVSILPDKKDEILSLVDAPVEPVAFFEDVDQQLGRVFVNFFGPCDGIVCVAGTNDPAVSYRQCDLITLWNPATREMKRLPLSRNHPPGLDYRDLESFSIGFGYDFKGLDYKVVKILHYFGPPGEIVRTVEVYSLKTDTWRKIDVIVPNRMRLWSCSSAYVDGFHYWWEGPDPDPEDEVIVCFDFANDVLSEIDPPNRPEPGNARITNYKESLALLTDDTDGNGMKTLWVLNKDNGINTWTKLFRVAVAAPYDRIVGILRNDNVLIYLDNRAYKLAVYDISSREVLSTNDFNVIYDSRSLQVVNYVESLVSFKRTGKVDSDCDL